MRPIEPPSAYVKGVVAMMVLTELFRIPDLVINREFLSTTRGYVFFFHYDLTYVLLGMMLAVPSLLSVRLGIITGLGYSVCGLLLTVFDPDFPHFARDPFGYILGAELPVSLIFTLGSIILAIMLVTAVRGYQSLKRGARSSNV